MVAAESIQPLLCFEGLLDSQLAHLGDLAEERNYKKGDFIQKEGEEANALYIVKEGRVLIEMTLAGQHVISVNTVQPGDMFGWSALVPPHRVTAASHCETDTTVIALPRLLLLDQFDRDPVLKAEMFERVARTIGRRLTETRQQVSFLLG